MPNTVNNDNSISNDDFIQQINTNLKDIINVNNLKFNLINN